MCCLAMSYCDFNTNQAFVLTISFIKVILAVRDSNCWNAIVCGKYLSYDWGIKFGSCSVIYTKASLKEKAFKQFNSSIGQTYTLSILGDYRVE